jgi:hypothetical protein
VHAIADVGFHPLTRPSSTHAHDTHARTSLLLWPCVALTFVLIVSLITSRYWSLNWSNAKADTFVVQGGCIRFTFETGPSASMSMQQGWHFWRMDTPPEFRWVPELQYYSTPSTVQQGATVRFYRGLIPHWILIALACIPTFFLARRDLRRRRTNRALRLNRCTKCDYDRANLDARSACPECGATPPITTA